MLLALSVKMQILVAALAVLAVQWPLAIFAAIKLFSDRGLTKAVVLWNVVIVVVPVVGPLSYLVRRKFHKPRAQNDPPEAERR